jgi:hypothetical protein
MQGKVITRKVYQSLKMDHPSVEWRVTMYQNIARPRAIFILWMACHGRLATKDRLKKFGVNLDVKCCFCNQEETLNHLFFSCNVMRYVWQKVLQWLHVDHTPLEWTDELIWLTRQSKKKGWKAQLLKVAAAETIYMLWKYRNDICFDNQVHNTKIEENIINTIVYRG